VYVVYSMPYGIWYIVYVYDGIWCVVCGVRCVQYPSVALGSLHPLSFGAGQLTESGSIIGAVDEVHPASRAQDAWWMVCGWCVYGVCMSTVQYSTVRLVDGVCMTRV
jgi:hypothetical protein